MRFITVRGLRGVVVGALMFVCFLTCFYVIPVKATKLIDSVLSYVNTLDFVKSTEFDFTKGGQFNLSVYDMMLPSFRNGSSYDSFALYLCSREEFDQLTSPVPEPYTDDGMTVSTSRNRTWDTCLGTNWGKCALQIGLTYENQMQYVRSSSLELGYLAISPNITGFEEPQIDLGGTILKDEKYAVVSCIDYVPNNTTGATLIQRNRKVNDTFELVWFEIVSLKFAYMALNPNGNHFSKLVELVPTIYYVAMVVWFGYGCFYSYRWFQLHEDRMPLPRFFIITFMSKALHLLFLGVQWSLYGIYGGFEFSVIIINVILEFIAQACIWRSMTMVSDGYNISNMNSTRSLDKDVMAYSMWFLLAISLSAAWNGYVMFIVLFVYSFVMRRIYIELNICITFLNKTLLYVRCNAKAARRQERELEEAIQLIMEGGNVSAADAAETAVSAMISSLGEGHANCLQLIASLSTEKRKQVRTLLDKLRDHATHLCKQRCEFYKHYETRVGVYFIGLFIPFFIEFMNSSNIGDPGYGMGSYLRTHTEYYFVAATDAVFMVIWVFVSLFRDTFMMFSLAWLLPNKSFRHETAEIKEILGEIALFLGDRPNKAREDQVLCVIQPDTQVMHDESIINPESISVARRDAPIEEPETKRTPRKRARSNSSVLTESSIHPD